MPFLFSDSRILGFSHPCGVRVPCAVCCVPLSTSVYSRMPASHAKTWFLCEDCDSEVPISQTNDKRLKAPRLNAQRATRNAQAETEINR